MQPGKQCGLTWPILACKSAAFGGTPVLPASFFASFSLLEKSGREKRWTADTLCTHSEKVFKVGRCEKVGGRCTVGRGLLSMHALDSLDVRLSTPSRKASMKLGGVKLACYVCFSLHPDLRAE